MARAGAREARGDAMRRRRQRHRTRCRALSQNFPKTPDRLHPKLWAKASFLLRALTIHSSHARRLSLPSGARRRRRGLHAAILRVTRAGPETPLPTPRRAMANLQYAKEAIVLEALKLVAENAKADAIARAGRLGRLQGEVGRARPVAGGRAARGHEAHGAQPLELQPLGQRDRKLSAPLSHNCAVRPQPRRQQDRPAGAHGDRASEMTNKEADHAQPPRPPRQLRRVRRLRQRVHRQPDAAQADLEGRRRRVHAQVHRDDEPQRRDRPAAARAQRLVPDGARRSCAPTRPSWWCATCPTPTTRTLGWTAARWGRWCGARWRGSGTSAPSPG